MLLAYYLFTYDSNHQFSWSAIIAEFTQIDTLPCAHIQFSLGDGYGKADTT